MFVYDPSKNLGISHVDHSISPLGTVSTPTAAYGYPWVKTQKEWAAAGMQGFGDISSWLSSLGLTSLATWLNGTLIPGVPNYLLAGGGVAIAVIFLMSGGSTPPTRFRRGRKNPSRRKRHHIRRRK